MVKNKIIVNYYCETDIKSKILKKILQTKKTFKNTHVSGAKFYNTLNSNFYSYINSISFSIVNVGQNRQKHVYKYNCFHKVTFFQDGIYWAVQKSSDSFKGRFFGGLSFGGSL